MMWQLVLVLAAGSILLGVLFGTDRLEAGQAGEKATEQTEVQATEQTTERTSVQATEQSTEQAAERAEGQTTELMTEQTAALESEERTDNAVFENGESVSQAAVGYDFSAPVPEAPKVDSTWFDGAVFIGDSRTEGLILNTGLNNVIEYTHKGLMVDTVFTKPAVNIDGTKVTVMDALKTTQFDKVYIMLGINETGWPYKDVFINKYGKVIDAVKEINTGAQIYVQQILPVSKEVSGTHSYIKNEKIAEYNALIQEMAAEKQVYFVAAAEAVAGEDGTLPEDAATDGIHLKKEYCVKWLDYLETHTVQAE